MQVGQHHLRLVEVARGGWGAALLLAPRGVMTDVHHVRIDTRSTFVARILGVRQLTQAVLSSASPSPEVLATGVWVDTAHALTALGLAVFDPSRAPAGLTDAAAAAAWALAAGTSSAAASSRHPRTTTVATVSPAGPSITCVPVVDLPRPPRANAT